MNCSPVIRVSGAAVQATEKRKARRSVAPPSCRQSGLQVISNLQAEAGFSSANTHSSPAFFQVSVHRDEIVCGHHKI
jgi:hypothetical protein